MKTYKELCELKKELFDEIIFFDTQCEGLLDKRLINEYIQDCYTKLAILEYIMSGNGNITYKYMINKLKTY